MPRASRTTNGGLRALREMRRALLRAGVAAGSLAVAVVMLLGHGSERPLRHADTGIDDMVTGSISSGQRYVVSRSVLQAPGSAPCLYFPDGTQRGAC